jgi:hypothetical protein
MCHTITDASDEPIAFYFREEVFLFNYTKNTKL